MASNSWYSNAPEFVTDNDTNIVEHSNATPVRSTIVVPAPSNMIIRSLIPSDLPIVRTLVTSVFLQRETMNSYLRTPISAFLPIYDMMTSQLDFSTSVVAQDRESGEIVACMLTADFNAPFDASLVQPYSAPIHVLLNTLDDWLRQHLDLNGMNSDKKVLHVLFGATLEAYEGRGISKALRAVMLRNAKEGGMWDVVAVECSNVKTQHLMRDVFEFTPGLEIKFADVEMPGGERPMIGLKGSTIVLYKILNL